MAAPGAGFVSLLDGEATALSGAARVGVSEGMRLGAATIVETGQKTALLRIDDPGSAAVDLGPATRAMLWPPGFAARGTRAPAVYLLQGWAKISTAADSALPALVSPALELRRLTGVAVVCVEQGETMLFVESGHAQLIERGNGQDGAALSLGAGDFYARSGAERGQVMPRPSTALLRRLPPAYRDTLPARAVSARGSTQARPLAAPSYAELQPWLAAEPALRRAFPQRFALRAREPEFRRALVVHLATHPEWRGVLFPPETEAVHTALTLSQAAEGAARPSGFVPPVTRP